MYREKECVFQEKKARLTSLLSTNVLYVLQKLYEQLEGTVIGGEKEEDD